MPCVELLACELYSSSCRPPALKTLLMCSDWERAAGWTTWGYGWVPSYVGAAGWVQAPETPAGGCACMDTP